MKTIVPFLYAICVFAVGCGEMKTEDDTKEDDEIVIGEPVSFGGSVQRAFELTVNGTSFSDSENFYTKFIDELILPNDEYKTALAGADVSVEGDYGLETFGANASVFMSSELGEGHVFQTKTDTKAQFSLEVEAKALDEIFKAKVVLRIGLLIEKTDTDPLHYCYLLTSLKEGIAITENSKPIIFDSFETQLNAYKCDDKSTELEIPFPEFEDTDTDGESDVAAETAKIKFDNFLLPVTVDSNLNSISYRPDTKSLYVFDKGTATASIFDVATGTPDPVSTARLPWDDDSHEVVAWDTDGNLFRGHSTKVTRYDADLAEVSSVSPSTVVGGCDGGYIADQKIVALCHFTDPPRITQIGVYDGETSFPPDLHFGALKTASGTSFSIGASVVTDVGVTKMASLDWVVVDLNGGLYLVGINAEGEATEAHLLSANLKAGESVRHITSGDGKIWLLTNNRLWKIELSE